jgi:uncharacterized integral membrane protein
MEANVISAWTSEMTRNQVLNVCAWLAILAFLIFVAIEKFADFEVPFSDEWKLALIVIIALSVLGKASKNGE